MSLARTVRRTTIKSAEVSTESVAPKPRVICYCYYCKFLGNSSTAIREHAATAHRGRAVIMITSEQPIADCRSPVSGLTAVKSEPAETIPELPSARHKETAARPYSVRSVDCRPVRNKRGGRIHCSNCNFSAPSARILTIHWSKLHQSDSENDVGDGALPTADDASVPTTTLEFVDDVVTPSTSSKSSTAPHMCSCCPAGFDTKSDLACHLSERHYFSALCVYCDKGFTNEKQALDHCKEQHPASVPKYDSVVRDSLRASDAVDVGATKERNTAKSGQNENLEGFCWYGRVREPVNLDAVYVRVAERITGITTRLTAATFLAIQRRRPALRIRNLAELL